MIMRLMTYLSQLLALTVNQFALANPSDPNCTFSGTMALTPPYVPLTGTNKTLIVFVQFSDDTFGSNPPQPPLPDDGSLCTTDPVTEWPYNRGDIPAWGFNVIDGTDAGTHTPNSLTDYFCKMSRDRFDGTHGKFHLIGQAYPQLVILDHPRNWYQNLNNHTFANEWIAVNREILTKVGNNPLGIDLTAYDDYTNGTTNRTPDGKFDMVIIAFRFHFGGFNGTSRLDGLSTTGPTSFDSLQIGGKDIDGGFESGSGLITNVVDLKQFPTLAAHEYGHRILGAGHFDYAGSFALMGSNVPSMSMCAYERELAGWISPQVITADLTTNLTITEAVTSAQIFKLLIPNGEYFLFENRQRTFWADLFQGDGNDGCDFQLPGTGLMIAHIAPNQSKRDQLWWERANGGTPISFGLGSESDPFKPGNKIQFTPWTRPNSDTRNSVYTGIAITNIQTSGNDIIVDIDRSFNSGVITENSWWEGSESITGNITVSPGVTLTVSPGANVTINPGAVVTVQGTLSIASNVTITGGGTIVTSGSGKIYVTSSADATAYNNSRKLVRDSAGNYHLVFESDGEICYEKWINSGTALSEFRRLSAGNGSNKFPSIAERSGKFYVFWQRKTGTNTYDTHFRHFTGTSWDNIRNVNTGIASNNDLTPSLAVSTPAASFEMMVVYRTNQGLRFRRSTSSTGATWDAAATVTSNTSARNPSLVYKANDYGYFNLTWDEGNNINHQIYYGGTTWGSATTVSNGTSAYNHQYSSYTLSGNNDRHVVWQAFEAVDYQKQAIYHNKNFTNIFTVFASENWDHLKPSGTGHTAGALTVLCHDGNNNVRKRYYNGSYWQSGLEGTVIASNSLDASVSIANPPGAIAKAVWRSSGSAPYTLTVGPSGGLSKSAADENWAYHRRVVFSLKNSATLVLQMGTMQLFSASGKNEQEFPVVSDQDSIKTADLASTLTVSNLLLPSDADSLAFEAKIYGQNAGDLRGDQSKPLDLTFSLLSVETNQPLASIQLARLNNTGTSRQAARLVFPVQALRGRRVHLASALSNVDLARVNGALVHVYEVAEEGAQKAHSETPSLVAAALPASFSVRVYPNPFNPSTQIYFHLPSEGVVTVQVYDVNGRIVRELSRGFRKAGDHSVTWDGHDELGRTVASGMYFTHVRFGEERKVAKMMLVR